MTQPPFDEIKNFINAAWDGDVAGMNAFLDKYPDAQEITKGEPIGYTALMWAAQSNKPVSIALLLDRGAKIDARDKEGETPLMLAANRGHIEAVDVLLRRGADVLATDNQGRTASDIAQKQEKTQTAVMLDGAVAARRKAVEDAECAAREALERAENSFQDRMRAVARSGRFRLRGSTP